MRTKKQTASVKYPSARLTGISGFMEFARQPNWKQSQIDINLMKKMGVGKGKEGLVVATLRFLGLIDENGTPTGEWNNIKQDYQATLKRLVEEKYSELFGLIPTKLVNQHRLISFFCSSGFPVETAEYQAKLFVWLCKEAGIEIPNVEEHFHRARFDKKGEQ
jgi:hypothetical protein